MLTTNELVPAHFRVPAKKLKDIQNIVKALGGEIADDTTGDIPWEQVLPDVNPGSVLRGLRFRDGKSQKWLAEQLGMKQPNVSAMEKGERPIGKTLAKKLGKIFNIGYKVFL